MFKIIKKDKYSKARLGVLITPHGVVKTPSYVMVGTYGQIRHLSPSDIKRTKTQIIIANTFHLWDQALQGRPLLKRQRKSLLVKKLGLNIPTMTDSGGFQVFSLAFGRNSKAGKIFPDNKRLGKPLKRINIKITAKGVYFKKGDDIASRHLWKFLGPELSIKLQEKLGADIIFAFDECTSFFDGFKYNKTAMERTHAWALKCIDTRNKLQDARGNKQMLFGIVQGGRYKSLRTKSAKFIGSLPFDGFGIGGSFGKEEMAKMLKWVIPHLPQEKPRHLLGIGRIEDIFRAVENGVDLFDCVIPTREARHGRIWTAKGHYDIRKLIYSKDKKPFEKGCKCYACKKITRKKLREMFKDVQSVRRVRGQRLATIHNVYFFNNLVDKIRNSIEKGRFLEFKNRFLEGFV